MNILTKTMKVGNYPHLWGGTDEEYIHTKVIFPYKVDLKKQNGELLFRRTGCY
jgi:hypothetical protein